MTCKIFTCLSFAAAASFIPGVALSQGAGCEEFVRVINRQKEKKSLTNISFDADDLGSISGRVIVGNLKISNHGRPQTLEITFEFTVNNGYPVESGDLLVINFKDGSKNEIIMYRRKASGQTSFMLIKTENTKRGALTYDDKKFYERLRDVDIVSFQLNIDSTPRLIPVTAEKSRLLRNIFSCIVDGTTQMDK